LTLRIEPIATYNQSTRADMAVSLKSGGNTAHQMNEGGPRADGAIIGTFEPMFAEASCASAFNSGEQEDVFPRNGRDLDVIGLASASRPNSCGFAKDIGELREVMLQLLGLGSNRREH
jgi:hypothetical protein